MGQYITGIAIFLMLLSPLSIPTAVSIVHAVRRMRRVPA